MSENTFERAGYNGVFGGTVLATKSVGGTIIAFDGQSL